MDALSEVLKTLQLENTICWRVELSTPWGLQIADYDGAVFCVVTRGSCWLEAESLEMPLPLVGGDLVVLPCGQKHVLRDEPNSSSIDLEDFSLTNQNEVLRFGGGGLSTNLVYGRLRFEQLAVHHPLLSALPPLILVRGEEGLAVEWLNMTMQFMSCEMAAQRPGAQTVISHLSGILFIQAVRAYIANKENCSRCWIRALTHPQIGVALGLIHEHCQEPWTVATLAVRVGMSRSAFSAEFAQLVGEPPLKYLTRWRMHRAARLLRLDHTSLAQIATQVGYESEAAFSKAFKRWMDESPGAYRHIMRAEARGS